MNTDENIISMTDSWVTEFAPKTIDDMVLSEDIKTCFKDLIHSRIRFSILLAGKAGIGKTTLVNIMANELNADVLYVDCPTEGRVDYANGKLLNWCKCMSIDGRQKIVILDELDSASGTQDNSFQKVLRVIVNNYPDVMFFGTCNYIDKVLNPIQSRLKPFELRFSPKDLVKYIKTILDKKNIEYNTDDLKVFANRVIKACYPDVRNIVSTLAVCCASGKLVVPDKITQNTSSDFLKTLVENTMNATNPLDIRKFYIQNKSAITDYVRTASDIFNYVIVNELIKDKTTILKMSDIIYQMNVVIDKEIQFFSLLTLLNSKL